ncbi:MAG: flavin reductase family protein [Beijerinckiaceae bacterium]|nr:flavin reductase family protein [Beijerinckiaceae bacterium]
MLFYEPRSRDKGILPHDPFKALIAPRPIGWVSTINTAGAVNLAPYSFFNAFSERPPIIGFSSAGLKDSATFAQETGEFVWNMPVYGLREAMNLTAAPLPAGQSEFDFAGLATAPSVLVKPPRVKASPAALECVVIEVKRLSDRHGAPVDNWLVLGEVVGVHIEEAFIKNGMVDMAAMQPIARCGYEDYVVADRVFSMKRPPRLRPDGTLER